MKPKNFPARKKKRQLIANKQDHSICESEIEEAKKKKTKKKRVDKKSK